MTRIVRILIPVLVCCFLLALYLRTMPPGLTWAFDGADGGDLVTAAATGGVPHPTGYPTYLLAASAFLQLPIGSLAYRTNLLSAACTVLAALMVYLLVQSIEHDVFAAAVAGLAFGTFPLVWSQAIITEVYGLNALFAAVLLYICARGDTRLRTALLGGLVAGLALGNHLSIVFVLPLLFVSDRLSRNAAKNGQAKPRGALSVAWRMVGLLLGLAVYLTIPLRAATQAPINWGNAVNTDGLVWLVSGKVYWGRLGDFNLQYLWVGVQAWSNIILGQLGVVGLLLVAIVLAALLRRSWIYIASTWLILAYSAFAIVFYSPDSYVYLIPALIALSICMGLGASWIIKQVSSHLPRLKPVAIVVILAYLTLRAIQSVPWMSLSADGRAEQYAQTVLTSAPASALIFVRGDEATFSLWYFHYAYHERPDVAVISSDLLFQPWYRTILAHTYPQLVVAANALQPDIIRDNPARPACTLGSDLQASVQCSP